MKLEQIQKIEAIRNEIGTRITSMKPEYGSEWEAMEKLTTAHKQIRMIDLAELSQQKMEL